MRTIRHAVWALSLAGLAPTSLVGQNADRQEDQELLGPQPNDLDLFGYSVAAAGGVAAVSAPNFDHGGQEDRGAVVMYRRLGGQWFVEQALVGEAGNQLGQAVACDGQRMAATLGSGPKSSVTQVYRFDGSNWVLEQRIASRVVNPSIALSGRWLALGDRGAERVLILQFDGVEWSRFQVLDAPAEDQDFGLSLAMDGERLLVGGRLAWAYSLDRGVWKFDQVLRAESRSRTYVQVGVDGDDAIASAFNDTDVYHWRRGTWARVGSIAVDRSSAAIGDGTLVLKNVHEPKVQVYRPVLTQWQEVVAWAGSDVTERDAFGASMAMDGSSNIVGAALHHHAGVSGGAAFTFELTDLFLNPGDVTVPVGGVLSLDVTSGEPRTLAMLAVVSVNGTPTFQRVATLPFDFEGRAHWSVTVPTSASGLVVEIAAYGQRAGDSFSSSNRTTVTLQ